jgi:hypothetical protein
MGDVKLVLKSRNLAIFFICDVSDLPRKFFNFNRLSLELCLVFGLNFPSNVAASGFFLWRVL